jgi:hypothetical protein
MLEGFDLGVHIRVDLEQVKPGCCRTEAPVACLNESNDALPKPDVVDEDALRGTFVVNASEEVAYRADGDGVLVALGLDDGFPPKMGRLSKATQSTPPSRDAWVAGSPGPFW